MPYADPTRKKANADLYRARNRDRINAAKRARYRPEYTRRSLLSKHYGMSLEEYSAMVQAQGNKCAICGASPPWNTGHNGKVLHVDHDHETGRVRGLLCNNCNRGIGMIGDRNLEAAVRYLTGRPAIAGY